MPYLRALAMNSRDFAYYDITASSEAGRAAIDKPVLICCFATAYQKIRNAMQSLAERLLC